MASAAAGRALPKFGEWDVNNPASAEGFTVIFNKARDEKKTKNGPPRIVTPRPEEVSLPINKKQNSDQHTPKRKWLCCG